MFAKLAHNLPESASVFIKTGPDRIPPFSLKTYFGVRLGYKHNIQSNIYLQNKESFIDPFFVTEIKLGNSNSSFNPNFPVINGRPSPQLHFTL